MKVKLRPLIIASAALLAAPMSSATILAGFNDFNGPPTNTNIVASPNYSSSFSGFSISSGGSADGTYGGDLLPVAPGDNGSALTLGPDPLDSSAVITAKFRLTNVSGNSGLNYLLFDAATAAVGVEVYVSYSYDNGVTQTPLGTTGIMTPLSTNALALKDYDDFAISISALTLNIGQTLTFIFSPSIPNVVNLDNVAMTAVPEPGSLLALGCVMGAGAFMRTRRRRA